MFGCEIGRDRGLPIAFPISQRGSYSGRGAEAEIVNSIQPVEGATNESAKWPKSFSATKLLNNFSGKSKMGALKWGLKATLCNLRTIVYNSEDFSLLVAFLLVTFSWLFRGFFVAFSWPSSA